MNRFVKEYCGIKLSTSDAELIEAVKACGVTFNNKVYVISKNTKIKIGELVENYFAQGASIIFFEEFYSKNENWLLEESVVSEEMLKHIIKQMFPNFIFTTTYFGQTKSNITSVIISEILRIWGNSTLLSYGQICKKLQFIPFERIKFVLAQNAEFIWNSIGVFTHFSKIDINEEERVIIRKEVFKNCFEHRYVSIVDLPLDDFIRRNYELSVTAVQNAAFLLYLSDSYEKRGKIITLKDERLDSLEIMREFCRSHDKLTLKELLDFEQDLTGECHRWIPMQAGYDVMIRINKDIYIADKHVDFDVPAIDEALEYFIHGEYTPIRTVTMFTLFPHCGQTWNFFLLESYLRRFSHLFRFEAASVNNKNAGCIVRKNSKLDYNEIMADAVAKANISLNEITVANFLFDNGYRGSRNKTKLASLIKQAEKVRNAL